MIAKGWDVAQLFKSSPNTHKDELRPHTWCGRLHCLLLTRDTSCSRSPELLRPLKFMRTKLAQVCKNQPPNSPFIVSCSDESFIFISFMKKVLITRQGLDFKGEK